MPNTASNDCRRNERKPLEKTVEVATGLGPNVRCALKDISQEGARLAVAWGWSTPDVFLLILGPELHRWSQVVWRAEREVGVQFVSPPPSIAASRTRIVLDT